MFLAAIRASASLAAPVTRSITILVMPSASLAICQVRSSQTPVHARRRTRPRSGVPAPAVGEQDDGVVGRGGAVDVEGVEGAVGGVLAGCAAARRAAASASVVRKASMVAMLGAIMPQPLAMPPSVKVEPCDHRLLGHGVGGEDALRRVVAAVGATASSPASASPSRITSIGSGVPMIPVEQTRTCSLVDAERVGRGCGSSPRRRPGRRAPVPALALPELTMIAAALPPFVGEPRAVEHDRRRDELVAG